MKKHLIVFGTLVRQALIYMIAPALLYLGLVLPIEWFTSAQATDVISTFITDVFALGIVIGIFGLYKKDIYSKLFETKLELKKVLQLVPLSFLSRIPLLIFLVIAVIVFGDQLMDAVDEGIEFQWSVFGEAVGWERVLVFLSFVVLGPIHEELFFRGVVFAFLKKIYSIRISIIYSTVVFTLFHFHPGLFPSSFILGLFLVFVFHRWNNLWYSIILHMLINAHPFILDALGLLSM